MFSWLVDYLATSAGGWTYPVVLLLVILDASLFLGFLLPGEAPLIVGGVLAGRGAISLWGIGMIALIGAFVGDSQIVRRAQGAKGFVVQPQRWIVERTFGWLNRCRPLSKDYEYLTETSEAMIHVAMINLMVRRLARHPTF